MTITYAKELRMIAEKELKYSETNWWKNYAQSKLTEALMNKAQKGEFELIIGLHNEKLNIDDMVRNKRLRDKAFYELNIMGFSTKFVESENMGNYTTDPFIVISW